jgi:O-antigen/teichoic acid export membrane protein
MLAYGVPALPAVLVGWLSSAGNRVLLAATLTLQDVAIAGLALKVAAIFGFIVFSLRLAWEPYSMQRLQAHASDPGFFARALQWYAAGMYPALALALLAAPAAVVLLAPPAYSIALLPALPMIAAMYWVGMTNMSTIGIQAARRTALLLPVYGWGAAANVAVLLAGADMLGPLSAGLGLLAGSLLSALLALRIGNRVSDVRLPMKLMLAAAAATAALALAAALLLAGAAARDVPPAWYASVLSTAIILGLALMGLGLGPRRSREMAATVASRLRRKASASPQTPP